MNEESFWVIPDDFTNLRTPIAILKEQASFLAEQTKGLLKGDVETVQDDGENILIRFFITVSALNNYRFRLLQYRQPVTLYPGYLFSFHNDFSEEIENEESFTSNLKTILSSEECQRIIRGLLAQAKETAE